ncbi:MAG: hypothetical protein WCW44_03390 [archaeon]|jgi:hypothetical protein
MSQKPTGQDRVNFKLNIALKCINTIKETQNKPVSKSSQKRIESNKKRIANTKKQLVFLSTHARDKVTRFYASNALKEIAQKVME